ncbi:2-methoxy-6-polyprenyl-1,4-benzoquinol methylase [subsurface metagenome]
MTTVQKYYDRCYFDYKMFWRIEKNLGIHYGFYDKNYPWGWGPHDKAVLRMNEVLASKAGITSADRVLDAGCGIGGSSIWLAKNIGCKVTGIDLNSNQIARAKKFAQDTEKFQVMNFEETSFPDGSFDVVWLLESSCYAQDKLALLKEAKRLLCQGGRLAVADGFLMDELSESEKQAVWTWVNGWAAPNLTTVSEFKGYLKEAGFRNISLDDITDNVMPSSRRMYWAAVINYPLGKLLEILRVRTKVQTANIKSAIYQYRTLCRGLWKYGIFTAEKEA